ncbi:hypothetical protein THAOC_30622, partial [Thalassiosira oceanica]
MPMQAVASRSLEPRRGGVLGNSAGDKDESTLISHNHLPLLLTKVIPIDLKIVVFLHGENYGEPAPTLPRTSVRLGPAPPNECACEALASVSLRRQGQPASGEGPQGPEKGDLLRLRASAPLSAFGPPLSNPQKSSLTPLPTFEEQAAERQRQQESRRVPRRRKMRTGTGRRPHSRPLLPPSALRWSAASSVAAAVSYADRGTSAVAASSLLDSLGWSESQLGGVQ